MYICIIITYKTEFHCDKDWTKNYKVVAQFFGFRKGRYEVTRIPYKIDDIVEFRGPHKDFNKSGIRILVTSFWSLKTKKTFMHKWKKNSQYYIKYKDQEMASAPHMGQVHKIWWSLTFLLDKNHFHFRDQRRNKKVIPSTARWLVDWSSSFRKTRIPTTWWRIPPLSITLQHLW